MSDVKVTAIDAVFSKITAEPHILQEIRQLFTHKADNYKFSPQYKARIWDGNICLIKGNKIYNGLVAELQRHMVERQYSIDVDPSLLSGHNISLHEFQTFLGSLGLPPDRPPREYQIQSAIKALRARRQVILSPTSSGKSLIIYMMIAYCLQHSNKALIIVPTIGLVTQMKKDFDSYNSKFTAHCSTDILNKDNNIDAQIVITTWQSLNNGKTAVPPSWYKQFDIVVADECHTVNQSSKAKTLVQILSSLTNCYWRFGTTGTLSDNQLNNTTLEGLLGPKNSEVTTKELMQQGYVSSLRIKCIVLSYPEEYRKKVKGLSYPAEIDFIAQFKPRNSFIKNLALSLKGNVLVFFRLVEKHGNVLRDLIVAEKSKPVYYIDGSVNGPQREDIRQDLEKQNNAVLIASLGTTSTGVSITSLKHMIAASPSKSKIKVLQSIGRLLRLHKDKEQATLYDIVDDLSYNGQDNFTLRHFRERLAIYNAERFPYKIYTVELK